MSESEALRVMIVDDEAIIAMLIADMLEDLGCDVVGQALTLADAVKMAKEADVQFAILDLNLGGEAIWPVAEILTQRQVPFAFASGFAKQSADGRYPDAAWLQKPFQFGDVAALIEPRASATR